MSREEVCKILAVPDFVSNPLDGRHAEQWNEFGLSLAFNSDNQLVQLWFYPGVANVSIQSTQLMTKGDVSDIIPLLLGIDDSPRDWNGFLIFVRLGIFARRFSLDHPKRQTLNVFGCGAWDSHIHETEPADLTDYQIP